MGNDKMTGTLQGRAEFGVNHNPSSFGLVTLSGSLVIGYSEYDVTLEGETDQFGSRGAFRLRVAGEYDEFRASFSLNGTEGVYIVNSPTTLINGIQKGSLIAELGEVDSDGNQSWKLTFKEYEQPRIDPFSLQRISGQLQGEISDSSDYTFVAKGEINVWGANDRNGKAHQAELKGRITKSAIFSGSFRLVTEDGELQAELTGELSGHFMARGNWQSINSNGSLKNVAGASFSYKIRPTGRDTTDFIWTF